MCLEDSAQDQAPRPATPAPRAAAAQSARSRIRCRPRGAPLAALASLANSACPAARSSKRSRMPSQTARSRSARTTSCAQRSSAVTIGMRACTLAMIAACTAAERRFSMTGEDRMLRTCEDHKHSATTRRKAPVCGTSTPRPGGFRFVRPLFLARRVLEQNRRQRGRKVYSLHAPEVECIGKGKAHRPQKAPECKTAHPPTRRSFLATHGLTPSLRPSPLRPRSRHPLPRYVRSVPASRQRALRALLRPPHVRWPAQHRQSPLSSSVTREERKGLYFLHRLIWREDHDARPCEEARDQLLAQRPFLVEA